LPRASHRLPADLRQLGPRADGAGGGRAHGPAQDRPHPLAASPRAREAPVCREVPRPASRGSRAQAER